MTSRLESRLKCAYDDVTKAKKMIEKKLEKETDPRKKLFLKDYKIELFDLQLRLKDMLRNLEHIE